MEKESLLAISVPEAGRRLGIGRSAAYQAAANKQLPVVKIGGRLLVPLRALDRLLDSAQVDQDSDRAA